MKKFKKLHKLKALLIAAIALLFLCTTTQAQPVKPVANTSANPDYVRALFTADKFLYAWKTRNVTEGVTFVSPALKKKISNDELASYISGTSSPSHAAFEINSGKKISDSRYAFEVKLYEYLYSATPESQSWKCPQSSRIVLIKTGVDNPKFRVGNWLVDELPATCELQLR
ncbi:hypothetical protein BV372_25675 [Nostoc sp. T09]|uniref:hypothetical protein n=1 Tax=Nostoc sp. T09 TaxID=1932621 RepID=UPI000A3BBD4A|nr:hypothetical protein [Nostoc sp. T09]OUL27701.1 hypothetical protein BV372_25675 [Nostoc sp. T09]